MNALYQTAKLSPKTSKSVKSGDRNKIRSKPKNDSVDSCIALTAKRIWPSNTAANLAAAAGGVSTRTAELWLAGDLPSLPAFLALLWSEHGGEFLEATMNHAPHAPRYWLALQRELKISQARQAEIEARKLRQRLEEGDNP